MHIIRLISPAFFRYYGDGCGHMSNNNLLLNMHMINLSYIFQLFMPIRYMSTILPARIEYHCESCDEKCKTSFLLNMHMIELKKNITAIHVV